MRRPLILTGMAVLMSLSVHASGSESGSGPGFGGSQSPRTPQQLVAEMIANENAAEAKHDRYEYIAQERSDRTGGHLWTELIVETAAGRMRRLLAVDGKPLDADRAAQEKARLDQLAAHPEIFIKHEQGVRAEEKRAREMLDVLPKDFLFENVLLQNGAWTMDFKPNPDYTPNGIEERVLHNMAGRLVINAQDLRLAHMEFHMTKDLAIGFGLLADVHPGTSFESDRQILDGRWHTVHVATQVRAKAVLFKTVNLQLDLTRSAFKVLDHDLSVPEAVALLEK